MLRVTGLCLAVSGVSSARPDPAAEAASAPGRLAQRPEPEDPYRLLDQLGQAVHAVEESYVAPVDRAELLRGALRGLVAELDPHSSYFSQKDLEIFEGDTSGTFGGIGVEVDFQNGQVVVIAPVDGSPAARAGVVPGDVVVALDGRPLDGEKPDEIVRSMRGEVGTRVRVTLNVKGTGTLREVVLVRERISVQSVKAVMLDGGVAYVRIKSFQEGTHTELLHALGHLRAGGVRLSGLILDLRNNPGGLVREATAVADEFLASGIIYSTVHREQVTRTAYARPGGAYASGPLVVLVNEFSASAAELLAGALKDHRRGIVVGARTFGKGSVQTVLPLGGGAALKLTTAIYTTPSGQALQARGVLPNVLVDPGYTQEVTQLLVRESDLSGHLRASEGPEMAADAHGPPPSSAELHLGVARSIPRDPTGGPDRALDVAYRIASGEPRALAQKPPGTTVAPVR